MSDMSSVNYPVLVTRAQIIDWNRERLDVLKARALGWANVIRADFGLPALSTLPKGEPGQALGCVLSNCFTELAWFPLSVKVHTQGTEIDGPCGRVYLNHPADVHEFILNFDAGMYRELELAA